MLKIPGLSAPILQSLLRLIDPESWKNNWKVYFCFQKNFVTGAFSWKNERTLFPKMSHQMNEPQDDAGKSCETIIINYKLIDCLFLSSEKMVCTSREHFFSQN